MSSCRSNSQLVVTFVNDTRNSTLILYHRDGLLSSQKNWLATLPPRGDDPNITSSYYEFHFGDGTNEFINVEDKVEAGNQVEVEKGSSVRLRTAVNENLRIDTDTMRQNREIRVMDLEPEQSGAAARSSRKKFKLHLEPRESDVIYEAGWVVALLMTFYVVLKYVYSSLVYVFRNWLVARCGFRNWFVAPPQLVPEPPASVPEPPAPVPEPLAPVPEPPASVPEPPASVPEPLASVPESLTPVLNAPAEGMGSGWVQSTSALALSAIDYMKNLKIWTHLPTANSGQTTLPL